MAKTTVTRQGGRAQNVPPSHAKSGNLGGLSCSASTHTVARKLYNYTMAVKTCIPTCKV